MNEGRSTAVYVFDAALFEAVQTTRHVLDRVDRNREEEKEKEEEREREEKRKREFIDEGGKQSFSE